MADTTNSLKINAIDTMGYETNYKFENPKQNLTLADVNSAFEGQFDSSTAIILSNKGYLLQAVREAYIEVVTKTSLT